MVNTFDLYCPDDDECYHPLSDLASTPEIYSGLILGLPHIEFLTTFVYEQDEMIQTKVYENTKLSSHSFNFDAGIRTCDWFDFLVCSLENKNKTLSLYGSQRGQDVCCFHQNDGILLVNPVTKVIENREDYSTLVKGIDSYKDSSGIMFNNVIIFLQGYGIMFDNSEDFKEDILYRSRNRALIEYDVWKEQTWKLICEYKIIMEFYKDEILFDLTENQIEYNSEKLQMFEEKIIGYKKRLNK